MATFRGHSEAFGKPGIEPRWTHGDKNGIGTAYSDSSGLWFTVWNGIVTEVYYPTVDRPQLRDLQYMISDGETFFHEEKSYLESKIEAMDRALGYTITSKDPEGRYSFTKEIITEPHQACLLQHTCFSGDPEQLSRLKVYVLCAPHLNVGGWGNNAFVIEAAGRQILAAEKEGTWLALATTLPFSKLSCGYVGFSDGWTDVADNFKMDWQFDCATDGNVALTGEIELGSANEFTVGLSFGDSLHRALTTLLQALSVPFRDQMNRFKAQWLRSENSRDNLRDQSSDKGCLYYTSHNVILAHEDKTFQGALIASLSIPWGEGRGDKEGEAGYHLVWTRDMVQSALGLLATGNRSTPLRSLIYLATSQKADGSFAQNFWIDGTPFWQKIQLDEVAFPILLADRLSRLDCLFQFDPYPMVLRGAGYLLQQGPITQQERWEETSGYSPSTLATNIAALICAAQFARKRGDEPTAIFLEEHADFLEDNVENWTATGQGTLLPGVPRHYVRINPATSGDPLSEDGVTDQMVTLPSQPGGSQWTYPARDIVDGGFLELVRYGIRKPGDPIIVDTLRVVDATLKVETPSGTCWRRYNHDGYGQREDGGPYLGEGKGRAWPLLAGERGHYELAAGGDFKKCIRDMEGFATPTQLLPEQVWDEDDRPRQYLRKGRPTGAAVPLVWAHAEYVKLLRSAKDGKPFDLIPEVDARYRGDRSRVRKIKVWSFGYRATRVKPGYTFRIMAETGFRLCWSPNDWQQTIDTESKAVPVGIHYVDLPISAEQKSSLVFTFYWNQAAHWEGRNFSVEVRG